MSNKPRFKLTTATQLLLDRLLSVTDDELVSYKEIDRSTGLQCRGKHRSHLDSARRILLSQNRIFFVTVIGTGLRRARDKDAAHVAKPAIRHISRTARLTVKKGTTIKDYSALAPEDKHAHLVGMASMTQVAVVTSRRNQKRLSSKVDEAARVNLEQIKRDAIAALCGRKK